MKHRILLTVLVPGLVCCCTLRAQNQELLHKTHAQRVPLLWEMYIKELPQGDSATLFTKIDAIATLSKENNDDDLLAEAGLLRAHYFYYRERPATLSILDSLREEGQQQKRIWLEALAQNMMALYNFNHLHQYQLGFEHHQKVYRLIKDLDPEDFPHKQHCLSQMAYEYYFFRDFRESLFYNLEALRAGTHDAFKAYLAVLDIMNTTGLCYQQLGMLDSADHYFRQTMALAKANNRTPWEGIASGNLGNDFFCVAGMMRPYPCCKRM